MSSLTSQLLPASPFKFSAPVQYPSPSESTSTTVSSLPSPSTSSSISSLQSPSTSSLTSKLFGPPLTQSLLRSSAGQSKTPLKFVGSGKVKDIYDLEDGTLVFRFSDRVSAYDVKFKEDIPKKGMVLCKFAEFWFNKLQVPNHFVKTRSDTEIVVKKMKMLPIECVVRGYFYGSLASRWEKGEIQIPKGTDTTLAAKLPHPVFDPTTKSEHDIPIDKQKAIAMNLVTEGQYDWLEKTSIETYNKMVTVADAAGFILADLKLEFGILDGKITLGDSIGPDEYRLWPKDSYEIGKIQES